MYLFQTSKLVPQSKFGYHSTLRLQVNILWSGYDPAHWWCFLRSFFAPTQLRTFYISDHPDDRPHTFNSLIYSHFSTYSEDCSFLLPMPMRCTCSRFGWSFLKGPCSTRSILQRWWQETLRPARLSQTHCMVLWRCDVRDVHNMRVNFGCRSRILLIHMVLRFGCFVEQFPWNPIWSVSLFLRSVFS